MRAVIRLSAILLITLIGAPIALVGGILGRGKSGFPAMRAVIGVRVMHVWAKLCCAILGVRITVDGKKDGRLSGHSLFVSNHLSYLDILVLAAKSPTLFVSMAEVANWPLLGTLAKVIGTIFIDRKRISDVARVRQELGKLLSNGIPVTFFPEGRASRGIDVAQFHSSLLEPAVQLKAKCTPISLHYESRGIAEPPSTAVCWWGDMEFVPHFRKLLSIPRIDAKISYGATLVAQSDRKELARVLREHVIESFIPIRQE